MNRSKNYSFCLYPEEYSKLKNFANMSKRSISNAIRLLLDLGLEKFKEGGEA